jgi:heat shock protein
VAFGEKQRILGVAAKNQLVTNIKNTIWGFKRFLGRRFDDPFVQEEIKRLPFKVVPHPQTGGVAVQVKYMGEDHVFSMEQIAGMLLTKLKDTTEAALQTKISDCVLSVCANLIYNKKNVK